MDRAVRGNSNDQGSIWTQGSFRLYRRRELINFAEAASRHRDFAQELPRFISEVRRMFTPEEIGAQLTRIEREQTNKRETFWKRTILLVRIRRVSRSELGGS